MGLLRVLDLEDTTSGVTDGDLEQIGVLLPRLKFLSLRGCKDVTRLPSSLGSLRQLQTLDIKGTSIVMLPPGIRKLEKLQYICAGTLHCTTTSSESRSQPPAAALTVTGDGVSTNQQQLSSRPRVFSLLSKLSSRLVCSSVCVDGVRCPAAGGIGKLTALHTLGVINVAGAGGKLVLRELKKIAQLRKLKLSGVNRKNWQDFCFAISGQGYLESLSVRLDDEQKQGLCCLSYISKPPETLKSLKLYGGNVSVSPLWMKQQLRNLSKAHLVDLELTISTQEDIDCLMELPCHDMFRHLRVRPIRDCELYYGRRECWWKGPYLGAGKVLQIDCGSYKLKIAFGKFLPEYVEVLVVHCSSATDGSYLELSGLENFLFSSVAQGFLQRSNQATPAAESCRALDQTYLEAGGPPTHPAICPFTSFRVLKLMPITYMLLVPLSIHIYSMQ